MTEIQGTIGVVQLKRLPDFLAKRFRNAVILIEKLEKEKNVTSKAEKPRITLVSLYYPA